MFAILAVGMLEFGGVFTLASFKMHYKQESLDDLLMGAAGLPIVYFVYFSFKRLLMTSDGATDHFAVWAGTLTLSLFCAYIGGMYLGWRNYLYFMMPYYEMSAMNHYAGVDPSVMSGGAFMDAGTIEFIDGSHLDLSKSGGFMNLDMYCVTPIVSHSRNLQWDFWAIGVNCCTGAPNNFACGSHDAIAGGTKGGFGGATGGLRLMSASELPFYQMAVTQAQTRYGLNGTRPIFFHWVKDAQKSLEGYRADGWTDFKMWLLSAFGGLSLLLFIGSLMVAVVKSKYR